MRRGWSRSEAPAAHPVRWWLEDVRGLSPLSRLRERVDEVRGAPTDGRVVLGSLFVLVLLVGGGFAAARALAGASGDESKSSAVRVITTRQKVRVKVHGRVSHSGQRAGSTRRPRP